MKSSIFRIYRQLNVITRGSSISLAASLSMCLWLAGCSGDPRPLQEAVEASNVGLVSLEISSNLPVSESNTDEIQITINHGQVVQFRFTAVGEQGETLSLENSNRRWSVSNSDVASISDSGRLVGRSDGVVSVGLRIGGILASAVKVRVSNAELEAISAIEGEDTLTECSVSDEYTVLGRYTDGTDRRVDDIEWSVVAGSDGVLIESTGLEAIVGALAPGSITLNALSGDISGSRQITVEQGLNTLTITPNPVSVERSATTQLELRADYADGSTQFVTDVATWSSANTNIATISDEFASKGELTGVVIGQTTVTALCGDASNSRIVEVIAPADVIRLNVEPDDDPIILTLASEPSLQLEVTAESSAGSLEEVTDLSDWRVVTGDDVVSVDNSGASRGTITALAVGTATIEISYLGIEKTITIRVR